MFRFFFIFSMCIFFIFSIKSEPLNDMVPIYSGDYIPFLKSSGDISEKTHVESFMINKYPITNFEFEQFILNNNKWHYSNVVSIFADKNYLSHWKDIDVSSIYYYPVVYVSWFAADAYCSYIGGRLPTIDEWEYVANAGLNTLDCRDEVNYFQNILDWYIASQVNGLIEIFKMQKNYWGVFGLHGVVWEWVSDFNSVILLNTDAEGGGLEEVLYCGATAISAVNPIDYVAFMRFAFRNTLEASYTSSSLGFRCVLDVK